MHTFTHDTTGAEVVSAFGSRLKDRTFLLTGPTPGGVGAKTAIIAAQAQPAIIFLLGRSESKTLPTIDSIRAISPTTDVHFVQVHLDSFASVREAAKEINGCLSTKGRALDVMVNNAAIVAGDKMEKTVDGLESTFAVNHLSHFLLTNLLMGKILKSNMEGGARVVNLTSTAFWGQDPKFEEYNYQDGKSYNRMGAYGNSKTANLLFSLELASKFGSKGLKSYSVHPGVTSGTGLVSHVPASEFAGIHEAMKKRGEETGIPYWPDSRKTLEQMCSTSLVAALSPEIEDRNGAFLRDCKVFDDINPYAKDQREAAKLWEISEKLVGE